jgi:hypothetical protein
MAVRRRALLALSALAVCAAALLLAPALAGALSFTNPVQLQPKAGDVE